MIPKSIWQIPKYGTINLHASLLPNYRGSAPINWTIINNENFTGVTTFFIDDKIDTGDVLLQEKIKVDKKINAGELHDKLKVIGAITVKKTIKEILNNTLIKKKQKQDGDYKTAYKLDKENIKIDWTKNCLEIHNKIRGLSPFPGARTSLINNKGDIKRAIFYESEFIVQNHNFENGQIIKEKDSFKITCNDGYLLIKNLKIEGKKRMNISSFLNGFNIENYKMVK
jgi:methionyl-tRNA formyltransferase